MDNENVVEEADRPQNEVEEALPLYETITNAEFEAFSVELEEALESNRANPDPLSELDLTAIIISKHFGLVHNLDYHDFLENECSGRIKYIPTQKASAIGDFFLWNVCRWSLNGSKVKGCQCPDSVDENGIVSIQIIQNSLGERLKQRCQDIKDFGARVRESETYTNALPEQQEAFDEKITELAKGVYKKSNSIVTAQGVKDLAAAGARPGLAMSGMDLDAEPWQMNFSNGVLDLKTGKIEPNTSTHPALHSRVAGCCFYEDGKDYKEWVEYLMDRFDDDTTLVDYLQERVGAAMVGYCFESATVFIESKGGQGKNTIMETIVGAFGEYGWNSPTSLLTANKNSSGPNEDLCDTQGRRLIWLDEGASNMVIQSEKFKTWTGKERGGSITASRKNLHNITFAVGFNFFWTLEQMPKLPEVKEGEMRRMKIVKFNKPILVQDAAFKERMSSDDMYEQVMAWAYDGLKRVLAREPRKVLEPMKVQAWSGEYFDAEDLFKQFFGEHIIPIGSPDPTVGYTPSSDVGIALSLVTARYRMWLGENGYDQNWGRANSSWVKSRLQGYHNVEVKKCRGKDRWVYDAVTKQVERMNPNFQQTPKEVNTERLVGFRFTETTDIQPSELPSTTSDLNI